MSAPSTGRNCLCVTYRMEFIAIKKILIVIARFFSRQNEWKDRADPLQKSEVEMCPKGGIFLKKKQKKKAVRKDNSSDLHVSLNRLMADDYLAESN